jgi:hypothetical protein
MTNNNQNEVLNALEGGMVNVAVVMLPPEVLACGDRKKAAELLAAWMGSPACMCAWHPCKYDEKSTRIPSTFRTGRSRMTNPQYSERNLKVAFAR